MNAAVAATEQLDRKPTVEPHRLTTGGHCRIKMVPAPNTLPKNRKKWRAFGIVCPFLSWGYLQLKVPLWTWCDHAAGLPLRYLIP